MAALLAEHGYSVATAPPGFIGVCFDGTGYGRDGTIQGGEFLVVAREAFARPRTCDRFRCPGAMRRSAIRGGRRWPSCTPPASTGTTTCRRRRPTARGARHAAAAARPWPRVRRDDEHGPALRRGRRPRRARPLDHLRGRGRVAGGVAGRRGGVARRRDRPVCRLVPRGRRPAGRRLAERDRIDRDGRARGACRPPTSPLRFHAASSG